MKMGIIQTIKSWLFSSTESECEECIEENEYKNIEDINQENKKGDV